MTRTLPSNKPAPRALTCTETARAAVTGWGYLLPSGCVATAHSCQARMHTAYASVAHARSATTVLFMATAVRYSNITCDQRLKYTTYTGHALLRDWNPGGQHTTAISTQEHQHAGTQQPSPRRVIAWPCHCWQGLHPPGKLMCRQ